ncbi:MAG: redoxin domain-containing protein [Dehalococcoidia bacterium]|nr:MAG: redoxin domain-containing protein [Dehalococcoidia bacterium]
MIRGLIDWRRALIAVPLLAAAAVTAYLLIPRGADASTPRASLVETPPGSVEKVGVRTGQLARDFASAGPDGAPLRLSELRGKPTIINFWATWCGSCVAELPDLKAVQQEAGLDNLNVVAVNAGEDSSAARRFLKTLDAPAFHIGMDPTLVVADAYGVRGLPQSVFLDADGIVRAVYTGQLSKGLMQQYVEAASAGRDGPEAPSKIRLVTTVARDHTLEVRDVRTGVVDLRSKSLRCDESYCAAPAIDALAGAIGVLGVERDLSEDPPRIVVTYGGSLSSDAIASVLAEALNRLGDPLYERPLEIVRK